MPWREGEGEARALNERGAHAIRSTIKRVIDLVLASALLLVGLPFFIAIAAAIRLDSAGPAFFRQPRLGRGGAEFVLFKFRTMHVDGDERLTALMARSADARHEFDTYRKLAADPRLTRFGWWLRRFSLDELPQLIAVLRGDMSLVGPRPYLRTELPPALRTPILQVRPGLTGSWQTNGRNQLSFDARIAMDQVYARHWTLLSDLKIIALTPWVILTGRGFR